MADDDTTGDFLSAREKARLSPKAQRVLEEFRRQKATPTEEAAASGEIGAWHGEKAAKERLQETATNRPAEMWADRGGGRPATQGEMSNLSTGQDIAVGLGMELPRATLAATRDAVQNVIDKADDLGGMILDTMGVENRKGTVTLPEVPQPRTKTGRMAKAMIQYVEGFLGAGKAMKMAKVGQDLGMMAKGIVQGGIGAFTVFDQQDNMTAALVEKFPELEGPIADILAADEDDSPIVASAKNAIEDMVAGAGAGVAVEAFVKALRGTRAGLHAKRLAQSIPETGDLAEVDAGMIDELLGQSDETMDLVGVRKAGPKVAAPGVEPGDVMGAVEEPEVFINWARMDTPEAIEEAMQRMADLDKQGIDVARRGVRTHVQTRMAADRQNAWQALIERGHGGTLNAEQTTQARNLWVASGDKVNELAHLAAESPSDANMFAFRKMAATHFAITREVIGARTETARTLNAWKISVGGSEEMSRQVATLLEEGGGFKVNQKLAKRIADLYDKGSAEGIEQALEKSVWARTGDAVAQLYINGLLLTNPQTYAANMVSNTSVIAELMLDRKVANMIGRLTGTENGVETGEAFSMIYGMAEGFNDAILAGNITGGRSFLAPETRGALAQFQKMELQRVGFAADTWGMQNTHLGTALDVLNTATTVPGEILRLTDEFYKSIGYRMEVHAQATRRASQEVRAGTITRDQFKQRVADLVMDPPEDIRLEAVDTALYQTFQNKPQELLNNLAKAWQRFPVVGRLTLPFRITPINIMTHSLEHTPLAPTVTKWRADYMAGGARRDLAMARLSTGTFMVMTALDLAFSDKLTGSGPEEPAARQLFQRMGKQDYSLKVGDRWFSFSRTDPVGMYLGMAGDIADAIKYYDGPEEGITHIGSLITAGILAVPQNMFSKTWLSGMANAVAAARFPDRYGSSYAQRLAGSIVPAGVAAVERAIDPELRIASTWAEQIKSRTPHFSKTLALDRDVWGRVRQYRSDLGVLYDSLSPVYVRNEDKEPVDIALDEVGYYPNKPSWKFVLPKEAAKVIGLPTEGVSVDLTNHPHLYSRYVELAGNELKLIQHFNKGCKDYLNDVVQGRGPKGIEYRNFYNNEGKAKIIKDTMDEYREAAKIELLKESPELQVLVEEAFHNNPMGSGRSVRTLNPALMGGAPVLQ